MRLDSRLEIARSPSEILSFAVNLANDAPLQSAVVKVVKLTSDRAHIDAEVPSGLGVVVHSLTRARQRQIEADLRSLKHKLESRQM